MLCGDEITTFRCLSANRADPTEATREEFVRPINYQAAYNWYLDGSTQPWGANQRNALSDAFYDPANLENVRQGIMQQVHRATGEWVTVEMDRDTTLLDEMARRVAGNATMPWTSDTVDKINRAVVGQMAGDYIFGVHAYWRRRNDQQKPGRKWNQPRPLGRNKLNREIEVDSSYYFLTDPRARWNAAFEAALRAERCGCGDNGANVPSTPGPWYQ